MSYIRNSLGANETAHYIAHFHWINYLLAYGALVVSIALGLYLFPWNAAPDVNANVQILLSMIPPIIGLIILVVVMVPIWTTEIGVTNQRIIYKTGFISRSTQELQLRSIEEVNMEQSVLGRIFNYGKIDIHGTGEEDIALPNLGDAVTLRKALQEAIGEAQNSTRPVSAGASPQRAPVDG
jgi:uncharacterized membrane protein YdbT with pleckstrin-like domain